MAGRCYTRAMTLALPQNPSHAPDGKFLAGNDYGKLGGRPVGQVLQVDAYLRELVGPRPLFLEKLVENANKGDHRSIEYLADRLAGKPIQTQLQVNVSANWADALSVLSGGSGLPPAPLPGRATIIEG